MTQLEFLHPHLQYLNWSVSHSLEWDRCLATLYCRDTCGVGLYVSEGRRICYGSSAELQITPAQLSLVLCNPTEVTEDRIRQRADGCALLPSVLPSFLGMYCQRQVVLGHFPAVLSDHFSSGQHCSSGSKICGHYERQNFTLSASLIPFLIWLGFCSWDAVWSGRHSVVFTLKLHLVACFPLCPPPNRTGVVTFPSWLNWDLLTKLSLVLLPSIKLLPISNAFFSLACFFS